MAIGWIKFKGGWKSKHIMKCHRNVQSDLMSPVALIRTKARLPDVGSEDSHGFGDWLREVPSISQSSSV